MSQFFSHSEEHIDREMIKVEVNLDDIPGEWLGYVLEKLLEAGANDAFYIPIYMKKNRPAVLLQLLCEKSKLDEIKNILFKETTTLGVRYYPLHVHRLARRFIEISTEWGMVSVKQGIYEGTVVQTAPEFEDCKRISQQFNVPLKEVYKVVWDKIGTIQSAKQND